MNTATQTFTIKSINTRPIYDPYVNLEGHHSHTEFWIDPRGDDPACGVSQEYQDNAIPMEEFHGHVLTYGIDGHPHEDEVRQILGSNQELLRRIASGWSTNWDGHNLKGRLNADAEDAWLKLCDSLDDLPNYYTYAGSPEDWFDEWVRTEINASATDEEIEQKARQVIEEETGSELDGLHIIFDETAADVLIEYCKEHRDELRDDTE